VTSGVAWPLRGGIAIARSPIHRIASARDFGRYSPRSFSTKAVAAAMANLSSEFAPPWAIRAIALSMSNLHSQLASLAGAFASSVLEAIRGASLEEILAESRAPVSKARREAPSNGAAKPPRGKAGGRLRRRSADDIAKALDRVVALVKKNKDGLRAEQIRQQLGMQAKEMPRILKDALGKRQLKSRGQKRATTYFAA
jgi:hypothetical protein